MTEELSHCIITTLTSSTYYYRTLTEYSRLLLLLPASVVHIRSFFRYLSQLCYILVITTSTLSMSICVNEILLPQISKISKCPKTVTIPK
ncbi:hypothetical protein BJX76DRAFT_299812 [Aspergillus varians]